jgi:hypothetical protein
VKHLVRPSRRKLITGAAATAAYTSLTKRSRAWRRGGNFPTVVIPTTLSTFVGPVPANINMLPWALNNTASDFTNSQFTKTGTTVSTGVLSPSGATDAQQLNTDATTGNHLVASLSAPQTQTRTPIHFMNAVIAKKGATYSRIVVTYENSTDAAAAVSIGFDLNGLNTGYDNSVGANATLVSQSITSLGSFGGGGWCLCKFEFQYNATTTPANLTWQPKIYIDNGTGTNSRSISFTGNNTNGINLWFWSVLPSVCWSMTKVLFNDDFNDLDTIDQSNSGQPGFNWYVNNWAPNSFMTTFGWTTRPPSFKTPVQNFSISSPSVLKLFNPLNNQNGFTTQIWSVFFPNSGGFVGNAFAPPLVYDALINYDGTTAGYRNFSGNPAFWGSTIDAMTGTPTSGRFLEWDVFESGIPVADVSGFSAKHDWSNPSSPGSFDFSMSYGTKMVLGTFQRVTGLWAPIDSSGWGMFMNFLNGQYTNVESAYSATALPQPNGGGGIVGQFSEADSQLMPVFLNTNENNTAGVGGGEAFFVDRVTCYGKP